MRIFPEMLAIFPEMCYNKIVVSQNLISRPVLLSLVRSGGKRETGANPVRTRHCKRGVGGVFVVFFTVKSLNFSGRLVA